MDPTDRRYTAEHEWVKLEGDVAVVGITDFAQDQLGDVVYVELPDVCRAVSQGDSIGTIESVKAVYEIFAPVSGEIVAVNATLKDSPETINSDPHGTWMMTIRLANPAETTALLDSTQYADVVKQGS